MKPLRSCSSKYNLWPVPWPRNSLEMQNPRPHSRVTESESAFWQDPQSLEYTFKFEVPKAGWPKWYWESFSWYLVSSILYALLPAWGLCLLKGWAFNGGKGGGLRKFRLLHSVCHICCKFSKTLHEMLWQTKVMVEIESLMGIGDRPDFAGDQSHLMSTGFLCTEVVWGANQWNIPV